MIRLTQPQRARLPRLLHMEYTLRELAGEIGCSRQQMHRAVADGCPCRVTAGGRVWVSGDEFRAWYENLVAARKQPLGADEAYCLRCRAPVPLAAPTRRTLPNGAVLLSGQCPVCQAAINRMSGSGS